MKELEIKKWKEMKICVLEINEWMRIYFEDAKGIPQLEKLLWFWTKIYSNYENPTSDLNRDWVASRISRLVIS